VDAGEFIAGIEWGKFGAVYETVGLDGGGGGSVFGGCEKADYGSEESCLPPDVDM